MSTSSNSARRKAECDAAVFRYQEVGGAPVSGDALWNQENESQQRETTAREAGRREGETQARASFQRQLEELKRGVAEAVEQFASERREYYLRAERELVQLALSIARKILHRESSTDPLLLAGMVRVLLEKMDQATKVTLRVNPHQVSEFRVYFAQHLQEKAPEVVEDPALENGRCLVRTELGSTEIGPEIQLKEIEQGLIDLQAARPQADR